MSIVGTRPPLIGEVSEYELHHRARLVVNYKTQLPKLPAPGFAPHSSRSSFIQAMQEKS